MYLLIELDKLGVKKLMVGLKLRVCIISNAFLIGFSYAKAVAQKIITHTQRRLHCRGLTSGLSS